MRGSHAGRFYFSDTIAENIAVKDERIDKERLLYAARMANVREFAEEQCAGYNTKIGQEGSGLSQGQKQRILIARAIYRNPDYLFLMKRQILWMPIMNGKSWKI